MGGAAKSEASKPRRTVGQTDEKREINQRNAGYRNSTDMEKREQHTQAIRRSVGASGGIRGVHTGGSGGDGCVQPNDEPWGAVARAAGLRLPTRLLGRVKQVGPDLLLGVLRPWVPSQPRLGVDSRAAGDAVVLPPGAERQVASALASTALLCGGKTFDLSFACFLNRRKSLDRYRQNEQAHATSYRSALLSGNTVDAQRRSCTINTRSVVSVMPVQLNTGTLQ